MINKKQEDLDAPFAFLVVLVQYLIGSFLKAEGDPNHRTGKLEFLAEVIGGGFPAMFQDFISAGTRIMATPLIVRSLWHVFFFDAMVDQEVSSDCCGKRTK